MLNRANIAAQWAGWSERVGRMRAATRPFRKRIAMFFAIVGPGLIVSNVDNDAGGIYTYAQAGAQFGNTVLWTLIPMTLVLYVSLEMCSRLGAHTGKGLSDLIREEFGFRVTFFLMAVVLIVNLGNVMAEFTGVFWATDVLGINKYVSVPLAAVLVWVLVVQGSAKWVERIFLTVCMVYFSYVISAFLAKPEWLIALLHLLPPQLLQFVPNIKPFVEVPKFDATYAVIIAGLVGTTIAPWQHFYLQAAVVEKRVGPRQYGHTRNDVLVGSISCMVIVFFIIVCTAATLHVNGIYHIDNAGTAALALKPLAGKGASVLFAIGLLNASIFAASILPLSTAYVVCEALGFESGIDRKFSEAKIFYGLYTALIILGVGLVLFLGAHANTILLWSQVLNGFLLPVVLIFILILVNRRDLVGDKVNSRGFNWVAWISTAAMILLTVVVAYTSLHDLFHW
ncbi:MAG TPA: divalent metal cation transporter [Candidatus Polarisedimenticolia bacterium]|nr:divalent metal cation transporter [Candidatus Polarisedimenticolia bacterium]